MSQPPDSGPGPGEEPAPGAGLPGGSPAAPGPDRRRDPRLRVFAQGRSRDTCPPGPALAGAVATLSGPGWRCQGATDDQLIGLLGSWTATESWAAAGKLAVIRELIRRRAVTAHPAANPDALPGRWEDGTGHEVAAALRISLPAADKLIDLAWTLEARLPRIGARLAGRQDTRRNRQADRPGRGDRRPGRRPQAPRARRARGRQDPGLAHYSGATAMAAYGLPTDAALSASANISQRADSYKKAKVIPDATMGQYRVLAFLDILNGISAADRIAQARAEPHDNDQAHDNARGDGDGDGHDDGDGDGRAAQSGEQGHALPAKANLTIVNSSSYAWSVYDHV